MSECSLSGHGQGHVSNFYIVDFEKFRHSKSSGIQVVRIPVMLPVGEMPLLTSRFEVI